MHAWMHACSKRAVTAALCTMGAAAGLGAATDEPPLVIRRTAGEIVVDGRLDDAGWRDAAPITTWYETRPGDNVEPKVANVAYLAYDLFIKNRTRKETAKPEKVTDTLRITPTFGPRSVGVSGGFRF